MRRSIHRGAAALSTITGTGLLWQRFTQTTHADKATEAISGQIDLLKKLSDMMDRFVARQQHFHHGSTTITLTDSQTVPWLVGLAALLDTETKARVEEMRRSDQGGTLATDGLATFAQAKEEALALSPFLPVADAAYENSSEDFLRCLREGSAAKEWGHVSRDHIVLANWKPEHERPGFVLFHSKNDLVLAIRGTSSIDDVITDLDIARGESTRHSFPSLRFLIYSQNPSRPCSKIYGEFRPWLHPPKRARDRERGAAGD